jgi:hypothetical protein
MSILFVQETELDLYVNMKTLGWSILALARFVSGTFIVLGFWMAFAGLHLVTRTYLTGILSFLSVSLAYYGSLFGLPIIWDIFGLW